MATALAYLEVLRSAQELRIAEETRDNAKQLAELTATFARTGQGPQADADRTSVELVRRRNEVSRAEEAVTVASAGLAELLSLDPTIQVKLLRVLQSRRFQRLGETTDREFHGKIIAATNRDLAAAMREGQFREDFYYRLCADVIHTPSLREQLVDAPDDVGN